ncbi:MAG: hypothetical protein OEY20_16200 [Gemmatimonadota bacterium]|nr:hypothetical protein [Gemmatimonadota bacterium]MDH5198784.1 hypothetical protein [Gemmatimonadota bacterium]
MTRSARILALVAAVGVVLGGCASQDGSPGPGTAPTLSLSGASGVTADVRRTVSEVVAGSETTLSTVDTSIWAPFNDDGAALAATEAGTPGPVGWLSRPTFATSAWSRYGSFVDSTGVLHELRIVADDAGPGTRIEYRRGGRVVVRDVTTWAYVSGGWVLDAESLTYHLDNGSDVRIGLEGRQINVAGMPPGLESLGQVAGAFHAWLTPRPLAAQFHFRECSGDWLKWMGTALLAELAWGRFLKSKKPSDFKKGMAATAAAGVALSGLVDCMVEQPDQPDPGA